jgi:GxxExxY protein
MDELSGKIIGAAIEVHRILGPGLLESIYETALCHEMRLAGLNVERQICTDVRYKDIVVQGQKIDILANKEIIIEVKSVARLPEVAISQLLSYLKAMELSRGLIINFGQRKLVDGIKRISL